MLHNVSRSLEDMLGKAYMETVQETAVTLLGVDPAEAKLRCTGRKGRSAGGQALRR